MLSEPINFDIHAKQRHFHFVLMRNINNYSLQEYWKMVGEVEIPQKKYNYKWSGFELQHRRIRSSLPIIGGKLSQIISASGDGKPPYLFDVFAIKMAINIDTYFAFVFSFSAVAKDVIDKLIEFKIRRRCDIQKVNLPLLISRIQEDSRNGKINSQIVGLQISVKSDPDLSSLSIGGDNPLKSSIYINYLKKRIQEDENTTLRGCVVKFEINPSDIYANTDDPRKIRTRIHLDKYGNFKIYLHDSGENIALIPYFVRLLSNYKALSFVSLNPLHRAEEASLY